jgi:hypothetical protein
MAWVIKPEAPYIEKTWNSIPNKSNVEWWNRNKNQLKKGPKTKIAIQRERIKIKKITKQKKNIQLKGEIEKKNNFNKKIKKKSKEQWPNWKKDNIP